MKHVITVQYAISGSANAVSQPRARCLQATPACRNRTLRNHFSPAMLQLLNPSRACIHHFLHNRKCIFYVGLIVYCLLVTFTQCHLSGIEPLFIDEIAQLTPTRIISRRIETLTISLLRLSQCCMLSHTRP